MSAICWTPGRLPCRAPLRKRCKPARASRCQLTISRSDTAPQTVNSSRRMSVTEWQLPAEGSRPALFAMSTLTPSPKAVVIFHHGYGEHCGRYTHCEYTRFAPFLWSWPAAMRLWCGAAVSSAPFSQQQLLARPGSQPAQHSLRRKLTSRLTRGCSFQASSRERH
jgi:hypothetical protein